MSSTRSQRNRHDSILEAGGAFLVLLGPLGVGKSEVDHHADRPAAHVLRRVAVQHVRTHTAYALANLGFLWKFWR